MKMPQRNFLCGIFIAAQNGEPLANLTFRGIYAILAVLSVRKQKT